MNLRSIVAMLALLAAVACSEPLEFADWTIEVPEGTPVSEYAFVPADGRSEHLEFQRDLVIAEGMGRGLYRSSAIAVAADGTIFVLDNGNHRVVAFDQSGDALREFGREGQGPGEFQNPLGFGVAGNRVLISDIGNNRLTVFKTDGELVADTQFDDRFWARAITAIDDELMMIIAPNLPFTARDEPYPVSWVLARYSVSG